MFGNIQKTYPEPDGRYPVAPLVGTASFSVSTGIGAVT